MAQFRVALGLVLISLIACTVQAGMVCYERMRLNLNNDETIPNVASRAACIDLCINHAAFPCKSLDYTDKQNCLLQKADRFTPGMIYESYAGGDYCDFNGACAIVYAGDGRTKNPYAGDELAINSGETVNVLPRGINNEISGIRLAAGCFLKLHAEPNLEGEVLSISERETHLGGSHAYNDKASSAVCACPCARLFSTGKFAGKTFDMVSGDSVTLLPSGINNKVSAVSVHPGCVLKMFDSEEYEGTVSAQSAGDNRILTAADGGSFNDKATSARCACANKVIDE